MLKEGATEGDASTPVVSTTVESTASGAAAAAASAAAAVAAAAVATATASAAAATAVSAAAVLPWLPEGSLASIAYALLAERVERQGHGVVHWHNVRAAAVGLLHDAQLECAVAEMERTGWVCVHRQPSVRVEVTHVSTAILLRLQAVSRQMGAPAFEWHEAVQVASPPGMTSQAFRDALTVLEEGGNLHLYAYDTRAPQEVRVRLVADDDDDWMEGGYAPPPLTPAGRSAVLAHPGDADATAATAATAAAAAATAVSAAAAANRTAAAAAAHADAAAVAATGAGVGGSGDGWGRGVGSREDRHAGGRDGGGDAMQDDCGGSSGESSGDEERIEYTPPGKEGTVRVWNGTDASGGRAVVRNWVAKAAFALWRVRLAQGPAWDAAYSAEGRGDAGSRLRQAWADLKRAWRRAGFARFHDPGEEALHAEPERAPGSAPALPAGCVRIDAALGEVPPAIFGRAVRVTVVPARRVRKARGGTDVRRAEARARAARRAEKGLVRAARTRARQEKERLRTPETREEVHSFHAKRRLLDPPYDPYEAAPKASRRSLGAALEEEALAARRAAVEEERAARWEERQKRQREDRAGERFTSACKRARQEAVSLLCSPSGLRPMPGAGVPPRPKRKPPEGASRGAKLARMGE